MSDTGKALSKPLLILLGVSLAFNLFFGGLWIGSKMAGGKSAKMERPPVELNYRGLRNAIQGDKALEFRRVMRDRMGDVRDRLEAQRELYRKLNDALTSEEVDVDLVGELLAEQRVHSGEFRRPMHDALLAVLPQLTLEERKKLVKALMRTGQRYRVRKDMRSDGKTVEKRKREVSPPPPADAQ